MFFQKDMVRIVRKITHLRELQLVQIKVLKDFMIFCDLHGIRVYMIGGSLIGAVRHKGFIPWDDDIDVSIPRPDYNKIVELHNKGTMISKDCYLLSAETDDSFNGYIPQIVYKKSKLFSGQYREREELKIGLSVFVYDGVPENKLVQNIYFKKMYFLRALYALCRADFKHVNTKIAKKIGPFLQPFFRYEYTKKYRDKILKYAKKYAYLDSNFVAPNADSNAKKELVNRSLYEGFVELEFEGLKCYAAKNYIEHLTKYYGDYMQLPPVEERQEKHSFEAWIDEGFELD